MYNRQWWLGIGVAVVATTLAIGATLEAQQRAPVGLAGSASEAWSTAGIEHARAATPVPYAPEAWLQQDPGDSLYKAAREALNKEQYRPAADLFHQILERYPNSGYAGDALYWEAFARYRLGTTDELRVGLESLMRQERQYPNAGTRSEAQVLATRIRGQLARRGDAAAAEQLVVQSGIMARSTGERERAEQRERERQQAVQQRLQTGQRSEEDEIRLAALDALLMMDSEQAIPVLQDILQRRDAESAELRQRAVLILGRKQTPETEKIMLGVVKNDPDPEVRGMAVMMLAQSESEVAFQALAEVVRTSDSPELKERAVYALAQRKDARSATLMREIARQQGQNPEVQALAVMVLGKSQDPANLDFIRELYGSTTAPEVKERILYSLASGKRPEDRRWLLDRALDPKESIDVRRQALFMAGQQKDVPVADIVAIYDGVQDREMREQMLHVLAMRDEPAAVDKLMDLARNDPDPQIRQHAILVLGRSKDPRVAEFLVELINK